MNKYYEIICDVGVIGVCSDDGSGENLLHVATEDSVQAFGRITKKQFESFGDDSWDEPISKIRFKSEIKRVIELKKIS